MENSSKDPPVNSTQSSAEDGPKFDYCCHGIERKDCDQCSRRHATPTDEQFGGGASAIEAATKLFDREIDRLNDNIELCRRQGQNRYVENLSSHRDAWVMHRRNLTSVAQIPPHVADKGDAVAAIPVGHFIRRGIRWHHLLPGENSVGKTTALYRGATPQPSSKAGGERAAHDALFEPAQSDAYHNLDGALIDIERLSSQGKPTDDVCIRTIRRVLAQLSVAKLALALALARPSPISGGDGT